MAQQILRQVEPERVRRIGFEHAVVTAPVTEKLVNVREVRVRVIQMEEVIASVTVKLRKLEAEKAQLEVLLAEFAAMKIERNDSDPDVPLEAPKADPKVPRARAEPVSVPVLPEPGRQ